MIGGDESWVTFAPDDVNAWAALILARSIKRTFTTRKLTILLGKGVSPQLKFNLENEFDLVIRLDASDLNLESLNENLAQILCWKLVPFKKCVFLDANSIMIENSDELFRKDEFASGPLDVKTGIPRIYVFRPSTTTFQNLLKVIVENTNGKGLGHVFSQQFGTYLKKKKLNSSYGVLVGQEGVVIGSNSPKVVNFTGFPWQMDAKKKKKMAENFVSLWHEVYFQDVLPLVQNIKQAAIRQSLVDSLASHGFPPAKSPVPGTCDVIPEELNDAIAIVGMSCRFPGANSVDEFWNLLLEGRDPIRVYPDNRPNSLECARDELYFRAGFLNCPIDEFDAKFFGISPREAPFVDPQQRLLLEVTWESLEDAGINPQNLKESNTGVFMGIWQQDYDRFLPNTGLSANDFHHRYLGNAFSATASRISYHLGLNGPSLALESGCSSSMGAIHLACQSLRKGETSLCISSGVNLVLMVLNPLSGDDKDTVVLSKDHHCKTFDESADGFVRAEGCGVVILKRYVDAKRSGDKILALIRGSALNNDGAGTSFGTPHARAQELVIRDALADANVNPWEVSYVEAHGTGTIVGDPTEMYAIGQVYSEERKEPLLVSSVKTNIGHAEAAAGIAGVIKVILSMREHTLPPHLHLKNLNPRINLDAIPAKIPITPTPWNGPKRIAGISSFSMSGTNVHLVLQEPPQPQPLPAPSGKPQLITISAKSEEALEDMRKKYMDFFAANPELSIDALAYTTNTGRAHLSNRLAVVAKDLTNLVSKLENRGYVTGKVVSKPKVGFLFTGQGSQYANMGMNLYTSFPVFADAFDRCDELFNAQLGVSLKNVVWGDGKNLEKTIYCQPAIFCIQYSLIQLWKSFGIQPDYVLGHSVGEFGAAVAAGVLSLEDAMKLVVERSRLVDSLPRGSMLAVKDSPEKVAVAIKQFAKLESKDTALDIAAINSEEEVVVSGSAESIENFSKFAANNYCGIKSQIIPASHAFHSRQMDDVLEEFGKIASTVTINAPTATYISGTMAQTMEEADFGPEYWKRHLRDTVRFSEAIKLMWTSDCKTLLEIGAQPILLGLAMANIQDAHNGSFCPSLRRSEEDWLSIFTALSKLHVSGAEISWTNWFGGKPIPKIDLPFYTFQRQKFWYVNEDGGSGLTRLLHPILGRQLPAPISDNIFWHSLRVKEIPYVEDHKVAERIILPAAAYLESILAAGREVLQAGGVQVPLTVCDLSVEAALELEKPAQIQTIVSSVNVEDGICYKVGIHRQMSIEQPDKWKRHAQGIFTPSTKLPENSIIPLDEMKQRLTLKDSVEKAYSTIAEIGIQFGPKFQSIRQAWTGKNEILTQINMPEDSASYICHPIVLDAMIQTYAFRFALTTDSVQKEMQLPIGIKKFVWLSQEPTPEVYAYTCWGDAGEGNVSLYSSNGERLAIMEGLELLKTTVDSFIRTLITDGAHLPDFLHETWRPASGWTTNRSNPADMPDLDHTMANVSIIWEEVEAFTATEWKGYQLVNDMFFQFLCRSIQECGFPWLVGETITQASWTAMMSGQIQQAKIVNAYFDILRKEKYLELNNDQTAKVLKPLPSIDDIEREIRSLSEKAEKICANDDVIFRFAKRIGHYMTMVLQGKMTPLALLFPDDKNETGASKIYSDSRWYVLNTRLAIGLLSDAVAPMAEKGKGKIRILEVGAGTGASSVKLMERLREMNVPFHYTFTDISPLFLAEARQKYNSRDITFEILNIEEDPLPQGFPPEQFDIIIGMQVIHATRDLKESLINMRKLLKPDGMLMMLEQFQSVYFLSLSFGLLDGWWKFTDFRKLSPIVSAEEWKECCLASGYDRVNAVQMYDDTNGAILARGSHAPVFRPLNSISNLTQVQSEMPTWIIVNDGTELAERLQQRLEDVNRSVINMTFEHETGRFELGPKTVLDGLNPNHFEKFFVSLADRKVETVVFMWTRGQMDSPIDTTEKQLCAGLLHLLQGYQTWVQKLKPRPKFFLLTRGVNYIGDTASGDPSGAAAVGLIKSFSNENPELLIQTLDVDQNEDLDVENELIEVFSHIWSKERELFVALREGKKFLQRLVTTEKRSQVISLPNSDRFKLINPASGAFGDIEVGPVPKQEPVKDEVELAIEATALNFRDLFMILKPEGFEMPKDQPLEVGLDISGTITALGPDVKNFQVGDEVFGFTSGGGLCSHVVVSSRALMKKPKHMTFAGASTIPCAFLTAYYSLITVAKMTPEDRVLIHVASGGVGLAAIQVAQHIGTEIYATAGSKRKRAYLRSLGIKNVYHSRNTEYGEGIMRDSKGAGVTIVLNSLTGPNFKETSLDACAKGAQFIEIAKLNIWKEEEVKVLRPDVRYYIIDLAEKVWQAPEDAGDMLSDMESYFEKGHYRGLPTTVFPLDLAREAFYHFQEAKHIGKIVVKMAKVSMTPEGRPKLVHHIFNPQSTYLITGGLGGLGMEVTKWMCKNGAANIVLAGRSPPQPRAQELIDSLNQSGKRIVVFQTDVGEYEQCVALLENIKILGLPPLRGIMHAAGVISDAIVPNQTWEKYESVLRPKVYGGWYLHNLTINYDMEFFVMFSSGAAIIGVMGQSNHSAANRYLDSLTHYRLSLGLKATTINWGAWSDVGAAAHIKLGQEGAIGMRSFTPARGIAALEKILREGDSQSVVLDVIDWNICKQFVNGLGNYLDEMRSDKSSVDNMSEEYTKMVEEIKASPPEERQEKIQNFLESILKQTLRIPENEKIDPDQNFSELGVDSLMAMEMRNRLQGMLGDKTLTVSSLQENRTLRSLSTHMANLMNSGAVPTIPVAELVRIDSVLPVDITSTNIGPKKPSEFRSILITGTTGHIGIHFIPELLKETSIQTLHCLIRAKDQEEGETRLRNALKRYELDGIVDMSRIQVVVGDVSKENLGLGVEKYEELASEVHAIVHCAIKANHLQEYAEGGENSMRAQNVYSTINIIRFAGTKLTKPILYASSLIAVTKATEDNSLTEEFPASDDFGDNVVSGYVTSKFVSEKLLYEATLRGIPATVIRYASIMGHSKTGAMPSGYNHSWNILLSCIRIKKFPSFDQNGVPIMAVDTAAKISTRLWLKDTSETGMYNLTSSSQISEDDIKEVFGGYGIHGEFIPFIDWRNEVFEEVDKNLLGPVGFLYGDDGESPRYLRFHPLATSIEQLQFNSISPKIQKNLPEVEDMILPAKVVVERHLAYYYKTLNKEP